MGTWEIGLDLQQQDNWKNGDDKTKDSFLLQQRTNSRYLYINNALISGLMTRIICHKSSQQIIKLPTQS